MKTYSKVVNRIPPRFLKYELVVLKKIWLMSNQDRAKYREMRAQLMQYLVDKGYHEGSMANLMVQKPGGTCRLTIPLGNHIREYLNKLLEIYNQDTNYPIELIKDLTELYQGEVLVA